MKPFVSVNSPYLSLPHKNVDTDMIIPAQFLTSVSREGYGENLFRRMREEDSTFPLNDPKAKDAEIFVVGENFGCGSSREHAVWAILGAGFKVVIGKSFADIFSSNSGKNGLLLITLPEEVIDNLQSVGSLSTESLTVNLEEQTVHLPDDTSHQFDYDPFRKLCLLEGLDDLDYIERQSNEIAAYRKRHRSNQFYQTTKQNNSL